MSDAERGTVKRNEPHDTPQAHENENGRAESWQAGPSRRNVRNDRYASHSHKHSDGRRTGLKATDDHATWRQVYRHCHVGVGMNE